MPRTTNPKKEINGSWEPGARELVAPGTSFNLPVEVVTPAGKQSEARCGQPRLVMSEKELSVGPTMAAVDHLVKAVRAQRWQSAAGHHDLPEVGSSLL